MKEFIRWCRRYFSVLNIAVVGCFIFIVFFQENSVGKYTEYSRTIDSLNIEIKHYKDTMEYYHRLNMRLSTDPQVMERVVREQYNMNREGEDVYIFK